jgi:hypothetical protein
METFARQTGTDEEIIAAANDTFSKFEQWLLIQK